MTRKKTFIDLLKKLGNNERLRLIHFSVSTTFFFVAYAMLYSINNRMEVSFEQEWAALSCVIVAGLSFSWAITLQIIYIVSRVLKK